MENIIDTNCDEVYDDFGDELTENDDTILLKENPN